jgi:hypothetical protein
MSVGQSMPGATVRPIQRHGMLAKPTGEGIRGVDRIQSDAFNENAVITLSMIKAAREWDPSPAHRTRVV